MKRDKKTLFPNGKLDGMMKSNIINYISTKEYADKNYMTERDVCRKCKSGEIKAKKLKNKWAIIVMNQ